MKQRVMGFSRKLIWFVLALSIAIEAAALLKVHVNAQTQPTPSADQVNAVASQLLCPVCTNISLDICPAAACEQMRELIREKLAEGSTPQEIKVYFVEQYGDAVLMVPPARGINWLLYLFPLVILLGAGYFVLRFFRRSPKLTELDVVPAVNNPTEAEELRYILAEDLKEDK
jgi:cytochrome c-type biogenesis protein CcmH